jgi:hypothetical protein
LLRVQVIFAEDVNSVALEQGGCHSLASDYPVLKINLMDAAGGTALF